MSLLILLMLHMNHGNFNKTTDEFCQSNANCFACCDYEIGMGDMLCISWSFFMLDILKVFISSSKNSPRKPRPKSVKQSVFAKVLNHKIADSLTPISKLNSKGASLCVLWVTMPRQPSIFHEPTLPSHAADEKSRWLENGSFWKIHLFNFWSWCEFPVSSWTKWVLWK